MRVGICLPIGERGPERRADSYRQMRDLAVAAEQGGADSIWVADHFFYNFEEGGMRGLWESMTILSALAEATERVELGPLVMCVPFRNPGLIAWMANTLDEISAGRFVLGLGAGWYEAEFEAFGYEFTKRVSVFDESLQVIVPMLRDGRAAYEGSFVKGHSELRPPGPRLNGPPILMAGTKPRMMSLIARWADRWNSVWYGLPNDEFRAERADLERACAAIDRAPKQIEVSAGVAVTNASVVPANTAESLSGSVGQIAEGLNAWREEGVDEVMCRMEPPSVELVSLITRAAEQVR
jgi:alkanesulfonate monooxygenase SsuD/methylene tetrahydromethanopterin reductase-like flavin-dependent oxidoreductase (luciferase family)